MSNAAKHSGADRIRVSLAGRRKRVVLSVEDNGEGFPVSRAHDKKEMPTGLGLVSMRERAELSGGILTIRSRKGRGTVVTASWPL
jgi:signal transduction histidine kinase